jgi:hypothetical protein
MPFDVVDISTAEVNPNNGDIAIAYHLSTPSSVTKVILFDKYGEKLFEKSYVKSGSTTLCFKEDALVVYIGKTSHEMYFYDRNGMYVTPNMSEEELKKIYSFTGWRHAFFQNTYYYENAGFKYRYEDPTIFRREAKLISIVEDEEIVIYQYPISK